MKKFISALTSLTIAATAMGGTLAMSTNAATNGDVSSTEITFLSEGNASVTVTKGEAAKIPVDAYVTKSQGFYSLNMKMVVTKDGEVALGKDGRSSVDQSTWAAANEPASKLAEIEDAQSQLGLQSLTDFNGGHWVYGTYGFGLAMADNAEESGYINPMCLSSSDSGAPGSYAFLSPDSFTMTYLNNAASNADTNVDSYNAFAASGMTYSAWNRGGNKVYTWENEDWTDDLPLNSFYVTVPADAEAGTYKLEMLTADNDSTGLGGKFYNVSSKSYTNTYFSNADNSYNSISQNALTIVVAGEDETTTTTTTTSTESTTTTTTTSTESTTTTTTTTSTESITTTSTTKTPSGDAYVMPQDAYPTVDNSTIQYGVMPLLDDGGAGVLDYQSVKYVKTNANYNDEATRSNGIYFDSSLNMYVVEAKPGDEMYVAVYASANSTLGSAGGCLVLDFSQLLQYGIDGSENNGWYKSLGTAFDDGITYLYGAPTVNDKYANTAETVTDPQTGAVINQKYVSIVWAGSADIKGSDTVPVAALWFGVPTEGNDGKCYTYDVTQTHYAQVTQNQAKEDVLGYRECEIINSDREQVNFVIYGLRVVVNPAWDGETVDTTTTTTTTTESTTTTTTTESTTESTTTTTTTTSETTTTTTKIGEAVLWGDANDNGEVTIADVVALNRYIAKTLDLTEQGKLNADVNYGDGLDSKDATVIKGMLAKLFATAQKEDVIGTSAAYSTLTQIIADQQAAVDAAKAAAQ